MYTQGNWWLPKAGLFGHPRLGSAANGRSHALAMGKRRALVIGGSLLFAVAVALVAFAWVSQPGTSEAATDGAAMSLRVDASQTTDCPGGPVQGNVCVFEGGKFDVIVVADAVPTQGYVYAQAYIDYDDQGLVNKKNAQALWPDCAFTTFLPLQQPTPPEASAACLTALGPPPPPAPPSFHKGDLFSFSLTCTQGPSTSGIELIPATPPTPNIAGSQFTEHATGAQIIPEVSGIQVNCVPCPPQGCPTVTPTPTATPTPVPPVGGVGLFPDSGDSSGSSSAGVFTGFAAMTTAIALAGAAWYARARRSRRSTAWLVHPQPWVRS